MLPNVEQWLQSITDDEAKASILEVLGELRSTKQMSGGNTFRIHPRLRQYFTTNNVLKALITHGIILVDDPDDITEATAGADFDEFCTNAINILQKNHVAKSTSLTQPLLSQNSSIKPPFYNQLSHEITFLGKQIPIPGNTDQDELCKTLLENDESMKKEWSWDEMLEEWGDNFDERKGWRKVYNAGREVNKKVAIETQVKDLFIVKKRTIAVNPNYFT